MPLYEYECAKCKQRFERIQKFSDPPIETCPKCKGPVARLLSSPALQFKGTGWYVTDYAKKGAPASEDKKDSGKSAAEEKPKAKEAKTKDPSPAKT